MESVHYSIIFAMVLVVMIELTYIGETSLAVVLIVMAISIAILAYERIKK